MPIVYIYIYICARYICIFYSANQVMSKNIWMSYRSILDLVPVISNLQMLSGIYVIYIYIPNYINIIYPPDKKSAEKS